MSPKIFEYKGIVLRFFSDEHLPIHTHAFYAEGFAMKVEFFLKGEKINKIVYKKIKGYRQFPPAQLRDLKVLIERYKENIVEDWMSFFIRNEKVKPKIINRKIK